MALNPRQAAFVEEFLVDLNAGRAAVRAGYSPRIAKKRGSMLRRHPAVAAEIERARAERSSRVGAAAETVVRELVLRSVVDIADAYDPDSGDLLPVHEIPEDLRRCISSIDIEVRTEGRGEDKVLVTVKRIRLWPKEKAVELLGRHEGSFVDRIEVSRKLSLEELLLLSMQEPEPEALPAEVVPDAPRALGAHE